MTKTLQDIFGTILCVGIYVAIIVYMIIWPIAKILQMRIKGFLSKRQYKKRHKTLAIAKEVYGARMKLLNEQNAILIRSLDQLNNSKDTELLVTVLNKLHCIEQDEGLKKVEDIGWKALLDIPESGRKGCNHTPHCSIFLRDEHEVTVQSWIMPRPVSPFEIAQLYLVLFDGFNTTGQGPELRVELRVRCTSPHCLVKNQYFLSARALTPDGFSEGSEQRFKIQQCTLNIDGNTPLGRFNALYTTDHLGIIENHAEFYPRHLRSVA